MLRSTEVLIEFVLFNYDQLDLSFALVFGLQSSQFSTSVHNCICMSKEKERNIQYMYEVK